METSARDRLLAGEKLYFSADNLSSSHQLGSALAELLLHLDPQLTRPRIIACIGTDRSTGDSLGPLVGTQLHPLGAPYYTVYGTLDDPIHATNLTEKKQSIEAMHPDGLIIAVDASLGRTDQVGHVSIALGGLKPGAGVNKDLPVIGHLHITGIVNVGGFMEFMVLQNTRLASVMRLADRISRGLMFGYYRAARNRTLPAEHYPVAHSYSAPALEPVMLH